MEADEILDLTGVPCPQNAARSLLRLSMMDSGQLLRVTIDDGEPITLVRINGAEQVVAGLALATGRLPRISAAVLAASLVPTTAAGHRFWEESDPQQKANQKIHFFKNVSS